uniref:AP complex mu/sigma subunit domain-containing protein n=1 Tax=Oncorhynchus kisutch TaxID=8019 RepID=A0A8C7K762_ONCKI
QRALPTVPYQLHPSLTSSISTDSALSCSSCSHVVILFLLCHRGPGHQAVSVIKRCVCVGGFRYASLYFCCAIENQDNELITLEIIHRYVELLDKYFGSVCELDIIFNFEKAYFILDEFLLGGEAQDTSKKNVLKAIEQADLLQEVKYLTDPKTGTSLIYDNPDISLSLTLSLLPCSLCYDLQNVDFQIHLFPGTVH